MECLYALCMPSSVIWIMNTHYLAVVRENHKYRPVGKAQVPYGLVGTQLWSQCQRTHYPVVVWDPAEVHKQVGVQTVGWPWIMCTYWFIVLLLYCIIWYLAYLFITFYMIDCMLLLIIIRISPFFQYLKSSRR